MSKRKSKKKSHDGTLEQTFEGDETHASCSCGWGKKLPTWLEAWSALQKHYEKVAA